MHASALEPALRARIEARLSQLRAIPEERALADYTFNNLFLFREAHGYVFRPGPYPCIAGRTYDGSPHVLPLFDLRVVPIPDLVAVLRPGECFFPIAAEVVSGLDPTELDWSSMRDDADYLYPAAQFLNYDGGALRTKRGQVMRFVNSHSVHSAPISAETRADALKILEGWCEDKCKTPNEADSGPCKQALYPPAGLEPLSGFIYYADERPAGFLLMEPLNIGLEVVRFAKGRRAFNGIFPYMFQDVCRRRGASLRWLNFEQDLGLDNFRRSKLSYKPAALLSKYRVWPKKHRPVG